MQNWRYYAYFEGFSGRFTHFYAVLYAKMFHGYDIMKHFFDR